MTERPGVIDQPVSSTGWESLALFVVRYIALRNTDASRKGFLGDSELGSNL